MKKLKLLSLEPRVLFDAAAVATAVDTHTDVVNQTALPADAQKNAANDLNSLSYLFSVPLSSTDTAAKAVLPVIQNSDSAPAWTLQTVPASPTVHVQTHEVVVIDTSIRDYQTLLESVSASAQIVYIDPSQDGMTQLATALQGESNISAIHLLSHGEAGDFALGTARVNSDNLTHYQTQLTQISQSLAQGGDILLYGCNVADGVTGIHFVQQLAQTTHADVAASTNDTGNTAKGGDWTLEYSTGSIEAKTLTAPDFNGTLAADLIAQTTIIPLSEKNIQTSFNALLQTTNLTAKNVGINMETVISISVLENNTKIVYDNWEDGYETDINNPTQSTTQIWTKSAGESITLQNTVNLTKTGSLTAKAGQPYYDGRDLIGSTKAISVTQAAWPTSIGTVLAGAINITDVGNAGTSYIVPIGEDTNADRLFRYTSAHILATQDNTTVSKNGTSIATLNKGETYLINGGIKQGDSITGSKPIEVSLIAGDNNGGNYYDSRWFALMPENQLANSYYAPVTTTSSINPVKVFLYNPSTSPITVYQDTPTTTGTPISVAANTSTYITMGSEGAHFYTKDSKPFYAVSTIDSGSTRHADFDWSYSLVPETYLTDKLVVSWGPGSNPYVSNVYTPSALTSAKNANPLWVIAQKDTTLQITHNDGSSGILAVKALQSYQITNSNHDQTGLTVYTTDGTLIAGVWGEDPSKASSNNPYLDMGTTIMPSPSYTVSKTSTEASTNSNHDSVMQAGEDIQYTVTLTNRGIISLYNMKFTDALVDSSAASYVAGSTSLSIYKPDGSQALTNYPIDDVTGSPLPSPLETPGYTLTDTAPTTDGIQGLERGWSAQITYKMKSNSSYSAIQTAISAGGSYLLKNNVTVTGTDNSVPPVTVLNKQVTNTAPLKSGYIDGLVQFLDSTYSSPATSYSSTGSSVYIKVSDKDPNQDPTKADTFYAVVTNTTTGEKEKVLLTETGLNTGVFTGALPISTDSTTNADNSGALFVRGSDAIKVDYTDPVTGAVMDNPANSGAQPNTANASITEPIKIKQLYLTSDGSDNDSTGGLSRTENNSVSTTSNVTAAVAGSSSEVFNDVFGTSGQSYATAIPVSSGNWIETGDGTNVASGGIFQIGTSTSQNFSSRYLGITPNAGAGANLVHSIDISSYQTATLAYDYKGNNATANMTGTISVKAFNGSTSTWATLATYTSIDATVRSASLNLPTNSTKIGFFIDATGSNALLVDNIVINATSANTPASPATFTQTTAMADSFTMPVGGTVTVTSYLNSITGGPLSASPNITAQLTYGTSNTTIATLGTPTYISGTNVLTWSGSISGSDVTIPAGDKVKLVVTNNVSGVNFKIAYNSASASSQIDLPAKSTSVIKLVDVDNNAINGTQLIGFYDKPYSDSSSHIILTNQIDAGGTAYVRVKVSDPFGDYDINGLALTLDGPGITLDNTYVVDTAGDKFKIYEYAWQTTVIGSYTVTAKANEGSENTIFDQISSTFNVSAKDLGTPSLIQFISGASGSVIGSNQSSFGDVNTGQNYSQGNTAYLRITDMDKANTNSIQAVVNGVTVTLTETSTKGVFEGALSGTTSGGINLANGLPSGTVLNAKYTDVDNVNDVSTAIVSVPVASNNAPTARDNAYSVNELGGTTGSGVSGNVITDTTADSDPDAGNTLKVTAINGTTIPTSGDTTIALPSGASLTINPDGSTTYKPNGQYDYLKLGETATDTFTYTIGDYDSAGTTAKGGTSTATVTVTITGVDTLPVANPDTGFTSTNTTLRVTTANGLINSAGNPAGRDTDVDSTNLTITSFIFGGTTQSAGNPVTVAGKGTLTIYPDGSYFFVPATDYKGTVPAVTYTLSDGVNSTTSTLTINVNNDPPVIDLNGTVSGVDYNTTFASGNIAGVAITASDATVTDADVTDLMTKLIITVSGVTNGAKEVVTIGGQAFPLNTGGSSATNVTIGGTAFDLVYSPTLDSTTGQVTGGVFTASKHGIGSIPTADLTTLIKGMLYKNTETSLITEGDRTFTFQTNDGKVDSNFPMSTVKVVTNQAPTLDLETTTATGGTTVNNSATFTEGGTAVSFVKDPSGTPITDDKDSIAFLKVSIPTSNIADGNAEQLLVNSATSGETISLNFANGATISNITLNNGVTYAVTATVDATTSTLQFAKSGGGTLSVAQAEALLEALQYKNTSQNPSTATPRVFTTTVNDGYTGSPLDSSPATFTVTVAADNNAPVVDLDTTPNGLDNAVTFTEMVGADTGANAVSFSKGATNLTDVDSPNLKTLTVSIPTTGAGKVDTGDQLKLGSTVIDLTSTTSSGQVTYGGTKFNYAVADNAGVRTVTFTSVNSSSAATPAPIASFESLLDALKYNNTSDTPSNANRVFDMKVTDSGDLPATVAAKLTVSVVPTVDPPTVTLTDNNDTATGHESISENSTLTGKTFAISARDGLQSIQIAGTTLSASALANSATTPVVVNTTEGKMTVKGYDSTTGLVTYDYDPTGTSKTNRTSEVVDNINIIVTDVNNSTKSDTLKLLITDTVPTAVSDSNSINKRTASISGNVIDGTTVAGNLNGKDTLGGDATTVTGVGTSNNPTTGSGTPINSQYGTLTIASNGSYTYAPNNANPTVYNLNTGQTLTDTFYYTLTDSDGNTSSTEVAITIIGETNTAPSINFDPTNSTGGANDKNFQVTYNGSPVKVTAPDAAISDLDSTAMAKFSLTAAGIKDGANEVFTIGNVAFPQGTDKTSDPIIIDVDTSVVIDYKASTGVFTFTNYKGGGIPVNALNYLMESITYNNSTVRPTTGIRTLSAITNDGSTDSNTAVSAISIGVINSPPVAKDDSGTVGQGQTLRGSTVLSNDSDPENDKLTVDATPVTAPIHGTVTLNSDGTYTYVNTDRTATSDSFVYRVNDGFGGTSTATVTIAITNSPPKAVNDTGSVVRGGTLNGSTVLSNDSDPENDKLTLNTTLLTNVTHGTLTLNADGTYLYKNDGGTATSDSFIYEISDGKGGKAQATVTINIDTTNAPPVAVNDSGTVTQGGTLTGSNLLSNDSDPNGDKLTLNLTPYKQPAHGTVTLHSDGTYVYKNDGGTATSDSFMYEISDGKGGKTQATVALTINIPNNPPKAVNDSGSVAQGGTLTGSSLLGNDSDPDNNPLTISTTPVTAPTHGSVVINSDGTYVYKNDGGTATSDSFVYQISDGKGGTAQATVAITITNINRPPVAVNDTGTILQGGTLTGSSVLSNDTDPDGNALIINVNPITAPAHGSVVLNSDGSYIYKNDGSAATSDSFVYEISDGKGGKAQATVNIAITANTNRPPVAKNDSASVLPGETLVGKSVVTNDSDPDNDPLTVNTTPVKTPTHGTLTLFADGSYIYKNTDPSATSDSFIYEISDGKGGKAQATVNLTIGTANNPPVAVNDSASVVKGGTLTGSSVLSNDSDPDGNALIINVNPITAPAHGSVVLNSDGSYIYKNDGSAATSDSFVYEISDGKGGKAQATVNIAITANSNRPPVAKNDSASLLPGETLVGKSVVTNDSDPDNDPLTVNTTPVKTPTHGTLTLFADGSYIYKNTDPSATSDSFIYEISDGKGGKAQATVNLTIGTANNPPVAVNDSASVVKGGTLTGSSVLSNDSDPDGNPLIINVNPITAPAHGSVVLNSDGSYIYKNDGSAATSDSFVYEISDGKGGKAQATVNIAITANTNRPPVAKNDSASLLPGETLVGKSVVTNDSDPDNDPLTVNTTPVKTPTHGTLTLFADGSYIYKNTDPTATSDSFIYEISDGKGGKAQATVNLTIGTANNPPVAVNDSASVVKGGTLTGSSVLSNDSDPDGNALIINVNPITAPAHGSVVLNSDGSYIYKNDGSAATSDSFVYEISDGKGGKAQATVNIAITANTNRPPVAKNDSASLLPGETLIGKSVVTNDSDPDNDPLTVNTTPVKTPTHGTLTLFADGSYIYKNTDPTATSDSFIYEISDGKGGKAQATVNLTIGTANNPPVAVNDSASVVKGGTLTGSSVLANDSDPDGNPLIINVNPITAPAHGSVVLNSDGSYIYKNDGSAATSDSFVYEISDGKGGKAQATVNIAITANTNRPPVAMPDSVTGTIGKPVTVPVLANDTDPENNINPATVQIVGTTGIGQPLVVPNQGTWTIEPTTGAMTFTPLPGFTGTPDPIAYTVKDSTGLTSNPTQVVVSYQQTAPVANPDSVTGTIGKPVTVPVLANDTDPENNINPATVQIVGTAGSGQPLVVPNQGTWTIEPTTGAITFTPLPGFTATPDPIAYTVKDNTGLTSNPAQVVVSYQQTAPLANPDSATGTVGKPVVIPVLANDTDAQNNINPATVQIVGTTGSGQPLVVPNQGTWTIEPTTGAITFTPLPGFTATPDPIAYTVKDSTGLTSNPTQVVVSYQQTAPVANPDSATGTVGKPVVIPVLANDTDAQNNINPATVQIVGTAGIGQPLVVPNQGTWTIEPTTGAMTFTPLPGFTGTPDPIAYTVKDSTGLTSNPTQVVVSYQQTAPLANPDSATGTVGKPVVIPVLANDTDAQNNINPATVQIVGTSGSGQPLVVPNQGTWTIEPTTGAMTFTPLPGFTATPDPIAYTVKDSTGLTSNPVPVTVDYQKTAPFANNDVVSAIVGTPVTINVLANDVDAENNINPASLQILGTTGVGQPLFVPNQGTWTVDSATGTLTFTPLAGFTGSPTPIIYMFKDTTGLLSNPAAVSIHYLPAPIIVKPIVVNNDSAVGVNGQPTTVKVLANDLDTRGSLNPSSVQILGTTAAGQPFVVMNQGTWSINPTTGDITFTPQFGFTSDPTPIAYVVKDNKGILSDPALVAVQYPLVNFYNTSQLGVHDVISGFSTSYHLDKLIWQPLKLVNYTYELSPLYEVNFLSYWDPRLNPVSLAGELADQFVTTGVLSYMAGDKFTHTDNSIPLHYEAALPSGKALPNFVKFNEKTGQFQFNADLAKSQGVKSIVIRVAASDPRGNQVAASFETRFDNDNSHKIKELTPLDNHATAHGLLRLVAALEPQFIEKGVGQYSIEGNFEHSDADEQLRFTVTLGDGSPLPGFIHFDEKAQNFTFDAEQAHQKQAKTLTIKVTVKDAHNHSVSASFVVNFEKNAATAASISSADAKAIRTDVDGFANELTHEAADFMNLINDLFDSATQQRPENGEALSNSHAAHAKHSLAEQVRTAGFFGYQQNKTQLVADLGRLLNKS